jgi:hypothetical protein
MNFQARSDMSNRRARRRFRCRAHCRVSYCIGLHWPNVRMNRCAQSGTPLNTVMSYCVCSRPWCILTDPLAQTAVSFLITYAASDGCRVPRDVFIQRLIRADVVKLLCIFETIFRSDGMVPRDEGRLDKCIRGRL